MVTRDEIAARRKRLNPEQQRRLAERLRGESSGNGHGTITRQGATEVPLSGCQQGLRFLLQLAGGHDPSFNQTSSFRIDGPLDAAALRRALSELEVRHETLRTVLPGGWPEMQYVRAPGEVPMEIVDLSHLTPAKAEEEARQLASQAALRAFDTVNGPVWHVQLIRLADDVHVLVVTSDHLVSDPWSHSIISRELSALYGAFAQGQPSPLQPPALQYADYVLWEQEWMAGGALQRQRDYWGSQLADYEPLQLDTRPPGRGWAISGFTERFELDPDLSHGVQQLSRSLQATPSMVVLTAFEALIALESGRDDVLTATFNLNRTRPEVEPLVGLFVNILLLRTDCSGDPTFAELVGRVRGTVLGALSHSDLPIQHLLAIPGAVGAVNRDRQDWIAFHFLNAPPVQIEVDGLATRPFRRRSADPDELRATGPIDLHLQMWQAGDRFEGSLSYSGELFSREKILEFIRQYRTLLSVAVADPERRLGSLLALRGRS